MSSTVQIRPGLFLNSKVVKPAREKTAKVQVVQDNLNHLFMLDRSGSMSGLLRDLCNDLIRRVQELPADDSVTLAWFSGEGQYRFVLKGVVLNSDKARKSVIDTISGMMSTVGMTCFSEVLTETPEVLKDLKHLSGDFTLFFLTDGNPCVSNYSREIENINKALDNLKGKLNYSAFVGYGDYYNKELMDKMASRVGGSSFHSENFKAIQEHIVTYIDTARSSSPAVDMEVESRVSGLPAFHIKGKTINLLDGTSLRLKDIETVKVTPNRWDKSMLYWFSDKPAHPTSQPQEDEIKGLYGAAVAASKVQMLDIALDVMNVLCDSEGYNKLNNAFTAAEIGDAEASLNKKVYFSKARPKDLLDTTKLKSNSSYSFLELITDLAKDGIEVALSHPEFEYKTIGVGATNKPGYPTFKKNADISVPMQSLVWNDSRLNLSFSAKIDGTVDLGPNTVGFVETNYPTFIYRTYTLIKDGNRNVLKLPVKMTVQQQIDYAGKGLKIHGNMGDGVAVIDVSELPVLNRSKVQNEFKATELADLSIQELALEAKSKALKARVDAENLGVKGSSITSAQTEFLKTRGINHNGFNPPRDEHEAKDSYTAPTFEIKIASFSSLPSINAVNKKLTEKKKLTPSETLLKSAMDFASKVRDAKSEFELNKKDLWALRHKLHSTKFNFLLSKKIFVDLKGREGTIDHNGHTITFEVANKEFEY